MTLRVSSRSSAADLAAEREEHDRAVCERGVGANAAVWVARAVRRTVLNFMVVGGGNYLGFGIEENTATRWERNLMEDNRIKRGRPHKPTLRVRLSLTMSLSTCIKKVRHPEILPEDDGKTTENRDNDQKSLEGNRILSVMTIFI